MTETDIVENMEYVRGQLGLQKGEFARRLNLSSTQFSRTLSGSRPMQLAETRRFAEICGLDMDDVRLKNADFISLYAGRNSQSNSMLHSLTTVQENLEKCREIQTIYSGEYLVYYASKATMLVSYLQFGTVSKHGIEVFIRNPHRDEDGTVREFTYRGYMLPVGDFLYVFSEQTDMTYEVFSIILHTSPTSSPTFLRGLATGIGVRDAKKSIASVPVVAQYMNRTLRSDEIDDLVGYKEFGAAPVLVQKFFKEHEQTISVG